MSVHVRKYCILTAGLGALGIMTLFACSRPGTTRTEHDAFRAPAGQARPHVIFLMIDTLRADSVGAYGGRQDISPWIDSLAEEGALFERAISPAPWTLPSIASLITGYPACVHQATSYGTVEAMDQGRQPAVSVLDDSFSTLAEFMQSAGYQTAGFCANKFIKDEYGFAQGFDHYDTSFAGNTVLGSEVNGAALRWIDAEHDPERPLFLYLHYMDTHGPYDAAARFQQPLIDAVAKRRAELTPMSLAAQQNINRYLTGPPAWMTDSRQHEELRVYREYWEARYLSGLAEMDHFIGVLITELRKRGLWDDALVVLLSDHGEGLGEHSEGNRVYWEHGYTQFQTELHVPLIFRWHGVMPRGARIPDTAGVTGVMPTILELLGFELDDDFHELSLVGHLEGAPRSRHAISTSIKAGPPMQTVVGERYKLIIRQRPGSSGPTIDNLLFDLDADPRETEDLAGSKPEQVNALIDALGRHRQYCDHPPKRIEPVMRIVTPEEVSRLKQVGYVGGSEPEHDDPVPTTQPAIPESADESRPSADPPTDDLEEPAQP